MENKITVRGLVAVVESFITSKDSEGISRLAHLTHPEGLPEGMTSAEALLAWAKEEEYSNV